MLRLRCYGLDGDSARQPRPNSRLDLDWPIDELHLLSLSQGKAAPGRGSRGAMHQAGVHSTDQPSAVGRPPLPSAGVNVLGQLGWRSFSNHADHLPICSSGHRSKAIDAPMRCHHSPAPTLANQFVTCITPLNYNSLHNDAFLRKRIYAWHDASSSLICVQKHCFRFMLAEADTG